MNLTAGQIARNQGISQVIQNNQTWVQQAMGLLTQLTGTGQVMTGEDMRLWLTQKGLAKPNHHNAWGAVIRKAVLQGLIKDTGQEAQMKTKASHARRTPVWQFN